MHPIPKQTPSQNIPAHFYKLSVVVEIPKRIRLGHIQRSSTHRKISHLIVLYSSKSYIYIPIRVNQMCSIHGCLKKVHAKRLCCPHYEEARRSSLQSIPCISNGCQLHAWRRKRCRACYIIYVRQFPHCHMINCYKPIFLKLKCQFHYRTQFKHCWRCHGKIYSGEYCRPCYDTRDKNEQFRTIERCNYSKCISNSYLKGLCKVHYKQAFAPKSSILLAKDLPFT